MCDPTDLQYIFFILYYDQLMDNYFTNYHTPMYICIYCTYQASINIQIVYTATTQTDYMNIVATK